MKSLENDLKQLAEPPAPEGLSAAVRSRIAKGERAVPPIAAKARRILRVMTQVHALIRKKVFALAESASLLEQTNIITRH